MTKTSVMNENFTVEYIPVNELEVDRTVQRQFLDTRKVEKIVRNFNADALDVITVSWRNDVTKVILDGAHRVEAIRRVTSNTGEVLCRIFRGLAREQEAQMFLDLNEGNKPTLIDRFQVRKVAGDKVAVEMDEVLRSYGWKVVGGTAPGSFQCVGAAEKIFLRGRDDDKYPDLFSNTIMVVTRAWENSVAGVMAPILEAISSILMEYGDAVDVGRLERVLRNWSGGPHVLMEDGRTLARSVRGRPAMGIATRIVDEYNVGLKSRKLYPWRKRR
jgi:hypothetical protein